MEAKRIRGLCTVVGLALGLRLIGATPLAAQSGCQPVDDAMSKIFTTPTHLYSTMNVAPNSGDKPMTVELIYAAGAIYDNLHGKWARSTVTLEQVMKQEEQNRRNSKTTCRYLRDEAVNGEAAAVYSIHSETRDQIKSDGQIWISKTKGLPLRDETDIDMGDSGKSHHSTRYEYGNVQPPRV